MQCVAVATGSCCDDNELPFSILVMQQARNSIRRRTVRLSDNTPRDSQILFEGTHNFRVVQNTWQGWTQLERIAGVQQQHAEMAHLTADCTGLVMLRRIFRHSGTLCCVAGFVFYRHCEGAQSRHLQRAGV